MLSEIRSGNLTGLMRYKEDSNYRDDLRTQKSEEFQQRTEALYNKAGAILDRFPQIPPEEGKTEVDILLAVAYPHRLTSAVPFANGEAQIELQMRELVEWRPGSNEIVRYGVRIEVADESLPITDRSLFTLYSDDIMTGWDDLELTYHPERLQTIEVIESLVEQINLKLPPPS